MGTVGRTPDTPGIMGTRAITPLIADTVNIIEAIVTIIANATMVHHNFIMAMVGYGRTGAAGDT